MSLAFDSVAVFDEKTDCVKFAGRFIDTRGVERFAICRVSREFLRAFCDLTDVSPELLVQAYVSVRDEVNGIAARQFAVGEKKPFIDLEHYLREYNRLNALKTKKGK
jgi:hypothetical protein